MKSTYRTLLAVSLIALGACQTEEAADEEFYFAEAKGEYSLAESYHKRAQYAREKQVEYLELAEEQEGRLRQLRGEIAKRRKDNKKRSQQVEGLKKESAALANEVKKINGAKAASIAAKKKLVQEIATEKAAIAKLNKELAALKAKRKALDEEERALEAAFGGPEKDSKDQDK